MNIPVEIDKIIANHFGFPAKPLFGAVATLDNGKPNVRTMRIYSFNEGCPILITHRDSKKWKEFTICPEVSICMVSENQTTQIIVQGMLQHLSTDQDMGKLTTYWNLVRPDVRKIYSPIYKVGVEYNPCINPVAPVQPPTALGVASVIPYFWELLQLEPTDYIFSQRYQFHKTENGWKKQRIAIG